MAEASRMGTRPDSAGVGVCGGSRVIFDILANGIVVLDTVSAIPLVRIFRISTAVELLGVIALTCTWMKANSLSEQSTTVIIAYHPAAKYFSA